MNADPSPTKHLILVSCVMNLVLLGNVVVWAFCMQNRLTAVVTVCILFGALAYAFRYIKVIWPLLFFVIFGIIFTLIDGSADWDPRSIWLFHAKRIFFDGTLYAQLDDPNFAAWSHNDYPNVFPALAATLAKIVGHWNEVFPKSAVIFFLTPPLLLLFNYFKWPFLQLIFLYGLAAMSGIYLFDGYADALVALYSAALIIFLLAENSTKNRNKTRSDSVIHSLIVFSFFSVLLLLKNEGLVTSLIIFCAIILFIDRSLKFKYALSFILALFFYLIIWKFHVITAHIENDLMGHGLFERIAKRLENLDALKLILTCFVDTLNWVVLVCIAMSFFRKTITLGHYLIPLFFILAYMLVLLVIYLSTPLDLLVHLGTSAIRTFLTINIVALAALIYSFNNVVRNDKGYLCNFL